jgi:hypothetical protein
MSSDTTQFDLKACDLELSLQIAFGGHKKAWGWKSSPERLIFAWHENAGEGFVPFVTPIGWEQAVDVVKGWCKEVADYGSEPDNDGHVSRSWRVYCDYWGFVKENDISNHYAFAAVEPYWAEYGK